MGLLQDIVHAVTAPHPVQLSSTTHGPVQYAPLTPSQQGLGNAQIAADGARMYNQAHPGQSYAPGQNGESYPGGINTMAYAAHMVHPLLARQLKLPQPMLRGSIAGSADVRVQGRQNPGYTPMQGSNLNYQRAPQPATFQPVQGSQFNPQNANIQF